MRRVTGLILVMAFMACGYAWAGEKEDYQGKLERLIQAKIISGQAKTIATLTLENAQFRVEKTTLQDDKANAELQAMAKEIKAKGFEIHQNDDGTFAVKRKPEEPKKEKLSD